MITLYSTNTDIHFVVRQGIKKAMKHRDWEKSSSSINQQSPSNVIIKTVNTAALTSTILQKMLLVLQVHTITHRCTNLGLSWIEKESQQSITLSSVILIVASTVANMIESKNWVIGFRPTCVSILQVCRFCEHQLWKSLQSIHYSIHCITYKTLHWFKST